MKTPASRTRRAGDTIDDGTAIVTHNPADVTSVTRRDGRDARARRWARHRLDGLVYAYPDPSWAPITGDVWHEGWMDRGWPERDARGRELLAAGWSP